VPVRVRATGGRFLPGSTVEDVTMATLEYPGGALAYVHSSWLNPLKVRRMTVIGERRMLVYDDTSEDRPVVVHDQGVDSEAFDDPSGSFARFKRALRRGSEEVVAVDPAEPLGEEIAHFALCIRKGREPRTGVAEALGVLAVLEACQRSLESDGAPVEVATP
jgi:predicted dehydrogenase